MLSEAESLDRLEEEPDEGMLPEDAQEPGIADGRALNFKGAIIRDASNPGDEGG